MHPLRYKNVKATRDYIDEAGFFAWAEPGLDEPERRESGQHELALPGPDLHTQHGETDEQDPIYFGSYAEISVGHDEYSHFSDQLAPAPPGLDLHSQSQGRSARDMGYSARYAPYSDQLARDPGAVSEYTGFNGSSDSYMQPFQSAWQ